MSIKRILEISDEIKDGRTESRVILKTMEEIGELATEISIANNFTYKDASDDGVPLSVLSTL